jgi:hypothetical protein
LALHINHMGEDFFAPLCLREPELLFPDSALRRFLAEVEAFCLPPEAPACTDVASDAAEEACPALPKDPGTASIPRMTSEANSFLGAKFAPPGRRLTFRGDLNLEIF